MKATVYFKDHSERTKRKTIETDISEVNYIVRKFIDETNIPKSTYVVSVVCGRRSYAWRGSCLEAYPIL